MEQRLGKPKVFLSHSKKNVDFIEKLDDDLRKCQIDTWLDTVEIRHGKSWQDSIFQYGLPTCDAVIVYFTELSIQSPVVKKEMDVALLQNLKDNNVAFLPYVSNEKLREKLRPDIQALQVPEWNNDNYHLLLPRVVAEVWRSYLERTVLIAVKDERLKRIQLELEIEKRKNQEDGVFLQSENTEFEFISSAFDRTIRLIIDYVIYGMISYDDERDNFTKVSEKAHAVEFNLGELFAMLLFFDKTEYHFYQSKRWMYEQINNLIVIDKVGLENIDNDIRDHLSLLINEIPDLLEELRLYGLIETKVIEVEATRWSDRIGYRYIYSEKFFRYRYWLAYHGKLSNTVNFKAMNLNK